MKKSLTILITIMLVSSGLFAVIASSGWTPQGISDRQGVYKAHILDASPDHYWIGTTTDTSVASNWQPAVVPSTGDNIYFSALSTGNCAWGLTGSYGSFNLLANFSRVVTQGASFSVTSYAQVAGTLTGSASYWLSVGGSAVRSGGLFTDSVLKLKLTGTGTLNWHGTGAAFIHTVQISADITMASDCFTEGLIIDSGNTLTMSTGKTMKIWFGLGGSEVFTNAGTVTAQGTAIINLDFYGAISRSLTFGGTINSPVQIEKYNVVGNCILTLNGASSFNGLLSVYSDHPSATMTLDLSTSNYAVSGTDITIGTRGVLNGRGSTITCSGNWDSSASSDTGASLSNAKLYLTGTTKTLKQSSTERFGSIMLSGSYTMQSNVYCANYWNNGTMTKAGYTLYVSNNQAPVFTAYDSSKWIDWFSPYSYTFTATDREAETLTFAKTSSLSGLTIGSSSGIISKSAPITNGTWDIHVSVSDGNHTAWKNYTIDIRYTPTFTDRYYWSNSTFRNWFNATYPNWFNATYDLNSTQLTNETNRTINYVEIGLMFTIVIGFLVVGIIIAFTRRKKHGET